MMRYALKVVLTLLDSVKLRNRLLNILVGIYSKNPSPTDSVNVCQCLVLMDNPQVIRVGDHLSWCDLLSDGGMWCFRQLPRLWKHCL